MTTKTKILKTALISMALTATTNVAFADSAAAKRTYDQACAACHTSGVAGSPKLGDLGSWAPRIAKGKAALYVSAINGKGAMPAKGGQAAISDAAIKAAVDYMVIQSSTL